MTDNDKCFFTDEEVEMLSEAFKEGDKRLVKDIIYSLYHDIYRADYPSRNPFTWPFRNYRTRCCWITKILTKKDFYALVDSEYVDDDSKLTHDEAKVFLNHYTDQYGVGWQILSGWTKFWVVPAEETGYRLVKKVGNPIAGVRKIAKILSPILILFLTLVGCTNICTSDEPAASLSAPDDMTTIIDSVSSPDKMLTVYNYTRGDSLYMEQGKFIVYRTDFGVNVEDGDALASQTGDEELAFLPIENIYQGVSNGKTIYLLQMDDKRSPAHDNTLTLAITIDNNQIVPVNVYRYDSQDTCIISNGMAETYRKL